MRKSPLDTLHEAGLITETSFEKIQALTSVRAVSVYWELKTLLYLGVLLLSGGLGILVYKHIDTIGHQAVLAFIALVSGGCFYYCCKNKLPFSVNKVNASNVFFDYILLLGCLTFITFIVYIQYQYKIFGDHFGLESLIPMLVLFFSAYYFDHLGVLCLAITNLAAWLGVTVTPAQILQSNNFSSTPVIMAALCLGVLLITVALASDKRNFKKHFAFTYTNFGIHILFIAGIAAMFNFDQWYLLWYLLLLAIAFYFYRRATEERSFYFMLITVLYGYVATSCVVSRLIFSTASFNTGFFYLLGMFHIAVAVLLILFLTRINKKFKAQ